MRGVCVHVCSTSLIAIALLHSGCSSKTEPSTAPAMDAAPPAADSTSAPAANETASTPVDPSRPETKWIGTIPYDVFFDQPLKVASDSTPVAVAVAETVPPSAVAEPVADTGSPSTVAAASTDSGVPDWSQAAPMSVLVDEVKQVRVRLEKNLQKVGDYNKAIDAISQDGAVLAGVAVVAGKHSEDVNWKPKAANIRDLAYQVYMKAEGTGSKPFNATKAPFEEIKRLLDGESPSEAAEPDVPLAEVADRGALMKRLGSTYDSMKSNINSPSRLKEEIDRAQHDLAMMNVLMTIMGDASYDRADDPRYLEYVARIVGQQKEAAAAAAADRFDEFSSALGKINNTCNECHMLFRTGSD